MEAQDEEVVAGSYSWINAARKINDENPLVLEETACRLERS